MNNTYTFLLYLVICKYILDIDCFKLDIGQRVNYSKEESLINVSEVKEFQNLYTHGFDEPLFLKEIYNKDKKLYYNPFITDNQVLLSATVLWVNENPLVVQLNLENSSLVLLNDCDSVLSVQAIFSERTDQNLTIEKHLETEQVVDVELSKYEDYQSNSINVQVTLLEISDPRFKRFGLKYYNLESNKLGKIIYNGTEIVTLVDRTDIEVDTDLNSVKKDAPLEIPSKEEVYGIYVYYFYTYPLMLEVLYSFNKRAFYAYTPKEKWHRIYLPSYNDPYYDDYLLKRLNYYGCINKYKWVIDIGVKTYLVNHYYILNNYCYGPNDVEKFEIKLLLPFYTDKDYNNKKYVCFEHIPEDKTKFYVDYLMNMNSILQLRDVPDVIEYIRVYHHLDLKPFLIVFVTPWGSKHYYVYEDKVWRSYNFSPEDESGDRFSPKIIKLLDELVIEDKGEKKVPDMKVSEEAIKLLDEHSRILTLDNYEYKLETIVKDKKRDASYYNNEFDLWWYNYTSYRTYSIFEGNLNKKLRIRTKDNYGLRYIKYYGYTIYNFENGIYAHKIDYHYDYETYNMTVSIYTNILYVYTFRKNYYESSYLPWKFIGIKPMKVLEKFSNHKKYYELVNKLNGLTFDLSEYVENPLVLLNKAESIQVLDGSKPTINTIYHDNLQGDKIQRIELEITEVKSIENCLEVAEEDSGRRYVSKRIVKTVNNCGINHIKYKKHTVKQFTDKKTLVHFIEYFYISIPYSITVILYTNTLYVYTFRKNRIDSYDYDWPLLYKNPARIVKTKDIEKYFQLTRNIENFDFTE